MKPWLLRLHRWAALTFALPLAAVIVTSLLLSLEPYAVMGAIKPGTLSADKVLQLLARHDPKGEARGLVHRSYEGSLTIGAGRGGGTRVDTGTGEVMRQPGSLSEVLLTARRMHESLLLDLGWLVIASTYLMLALTAVGLLMGWPRFSNTLAGWHMGLAWVLLPLLVLSPLTGLFIAHGMSFAAPPPAEANTGGQMKLADAVRAAGARHDLSGLVWLRPQGGRTAMRVVEGGEYRIYAVTPTGTVAMPRNWPRLWHEGNFGGMIGALPNLVTALAACALLVTGVWAWAGRRLRLASRRRQIEFAKAHST